MSFDQFTQVLATTLVLCSCTQAERLVVVQSDANVGGAGGWQPFSVPVLVPQLVGRTTPIHDPSLPADELEIFVSYGPSPGSQIWRSGRASADDYWSPAEAVTELSSAGNDLDPDVSPDGLTMYFASDRAGSGFRLYVTRRATRVGTWEAAEPMAQLGTSDLDLAPSVDPSGLYMLFASQRGTSDIRLYSASRSDPLGAWETVAAIDALKSGRQDQNPALFNRDLSLVWSSRRSLTGNTSDLYEVDRGNTSVDFSNELVPLDTLNSATDWEGDPWLSQDGRHIFFVSERDGNVPQLYEARR